jgi:hypothetical protein
MSDDYRWIVESEAWPKSYKIFRGSIPFHIHAVSEEEANIRFRQFHQFLEHMAFFTDDGLTHSAMTYVLPQSINGEQPELTLELLEEVSIDSAEDLRPSIGSGDLWEWTWLRPMEEGDYDPLAIARRAFGWDDEDDEEE